MTTNTNLLALNELHASSHGTKHPRHGAVVKNLLRDGLCHVSTVNPVLGHFVPPDWVAKVLSGPQVLHLPDLGPQEVLLDVVVIINDSHSLHEASQIANFVHPELLQLRGRDPLSIRGPSLSAMGIHAHERILNHGIAIGSCWVLDNSVLNILDWLLIEVLERERLNGRRLHGLLLEGAIDWSLETLLNKLFLHFVEIGHIALSPALRLPVPHVQVLLHLLHTKT